MPSSSVDGKKLGEIEIFEAPHGPSAQSEPFDKYLYWLDKTDN
jgi:hypothetical protein